MVPQEDADRVPKRPGPDPEKLKLDETWEKAVEKALKKPPPREKLAADPPRKRRGGRRP